MTNRYFPQNCTWWARTASDGYGGILFAEPVVLGCRWEDKQQLFRNRSGDEEMSAAIAYIDRAIEVGDFLIFGNYLHVTNPSLLDGAYEVKQFSITPDIRVLKSQFKAFM